MTTARGRVAALLACLCALAGAAATAKTSEQRLLAFGSPAGWILIDARKGSAEPLRLPSGVIARDVAIAPGGSRVAYTAHDQIANNDLLYIWDRHGTEAPRSVGDKQGFHADPSFSDDGTWIYFAHNPDASPGYVMSHGRRIYAQLYRVRVDGTGLEALSDEPGCHFAPVLREQRLFYVHATCIGSERALERRDLASSAVKPLLRQTAPMDEISLSPAGDRAVYSVQEIDTFSLWELDLGKGSTRLLVRYQRNGHRAQPRYSQDGKRVFYLRSGAVWVHLGGKDEEVARIDKRGKL